MKPRYATFPVLPPRRRRAGSALIAAALLCAWPAAAPAEDTPEASRLEGAAAAQAGQSHRRAAIRLYQQAYATAPSRELLGKIAGEYEALAAGDPRDLRLAIFYYEERLLGEGQTPERADVEARLTRLRTLKEVPPPPPLAPVAPPPANAATPAPATWTTVQPPLPTSTRPRNSPGLMAGGIALIALGAAEVTAAVYTFAITAASGDSDDEENGQVIGIPLLVDGAGCLAGGIAMVVVGNRRVPLRATVAPIVLPPLPAGTSPRGAAAPAGLAIVGTF